MLWTIFVILLVLWLLGVVTSYTLGGFIHVLLIIEVAASSLRFDQDTKRPLYARHGISELWLADLGGRRLTRYRAPQHGAYTLVDEPELGPALEVEALSGVSVDLRLLFG